MIGEKLRHATNIAAFALAYASIAFMGWAARLLVQQPYDGLTWSIISGQVQDVHPLGPAHDVLQPGDVILAVDGVSPERALPLYLGKQAGDTVTYTIERNTKGITHIEISLTTAPLSRAFQRLVFYIIAFAFWVVGVAVMAFAQRTEKAGALFLCCMTGGIVLSSGALSPTGPSWVSSLFNISLWVIGPLMIHFHLIFLETSLKYKRLLLGALYGIAVTGSAPYMIWGADIVRASDWIEFLYGAGRLTVATGFLVSIALLAYTFKSSYKIRVKQQIRIVTLTGSLALLPVVILGVLPDALFQQHILPYEVSFLFLIAIPIGYGYTIVRHRLIRMDRFLNRGATYTLAIAGLATLYLIIAAILENIFPDQVQNSLLAHLLIAITLSMIYPQIHQMVQKLIDWVFYGGWYDYRTAVEQITQGLKYINDSNVLARTLSARMRETLRLESAAVLLMGPFGEICEVDGIDRETINGEFPWNNSSPMIPENGFLHELLQNLTAPIETRLIHKGLSGVSITAGERKLLNMIEGRIWAPIRGNESFLGLLILGPRLGNEAFSTIDMHIIQLVVQHLGALTQNLILLSELRLRASEVERLHAKIVRTREEERKLLARELHDEVTQALIGLNYALSRAIEENRDHLKEEVRSILDTIRRICRQLRPPALDNLGLNTALRSLVREFKGMNREKLHIEFHTNCDEEMWVPDEIAVCLYRVLFEALRNIEKHANADYVNVELERIQNEICLTVEDNGLGFSVPSKLGLLVANDHFGLVGIREWLELVHGAFEIKSSPGKGTYIMARVPFPQPDAISTVETERAIL